MKKKKFKLPAHVLEDMIKAPKGDNLEDLQREELSGDHAVRTLEVSDTDDDEDEGVGDGEMGRSNDDPFKK
jgi:hypothetical protein